MVFTWAITHVGSETKGGVKIEQSNVNSFFCLFISFLFLMPVMRVCVCIDGWVGGWVLLWIESCMGLE